MTPKLLILLVSGTPDFREKIREIVLLHPHRSKYLEFDFQPRVQRSDNGAKTENGPSSWNEAAHEESAHVPPPLPPPPPPPPPTHDCPTLQTSIRARREVKMVNAQAYKSVVGEIRSPSFV